MFTSPGTCRIQGCIQVAASLQVEIEYYTLKVACNLPSFRITTRLDVLQHQRCTQLNEPQALLETCHTLGAQLPKGLITMTTSCLISWSFIHVCECVF